MLDPCKMNQNDIFHNINIQSCFMMFHILFTQPKRAFWGVFLVRFVGGKSAIGFEDPKTHGSRLTPGLKLKSPAKIKGASPANLGGWLEMQKKNILTKHNPAVVLGYNVKWLLPLTWQLQGWPMLQSFWYQDFDSKPCEAALLLYTWCEKLPWSTIRTNMCSQISRNRMNVKGITA